MADVTGHHWELVRITVKSEAKYRMVVEGKGFFSEERTQIQGETFTL